MENSKASTTGAVEQSGASGQTNTMPEEAFYPYYIKVTYDYLLENMRAFEVPPKLYENELITEHERDLVMGGKTPFIQNKTLLDLLKDEKICACFFDALRQKGQAFLADKVIENGRRISRERNYMPIIPGARAEFGADTKFEFITELERSRFPIDVLSAMESVKKEEASERLKGFVSKKHEESTPRDFAAVPTCNIALIGKTGDGKSSIGNLILGYNAFAVDDSSDRVTTTVIAKEGQIDRVNLRVIDTPGLCDSRMTTEDVRFETAKFLDTFDEGVHVFLFAKNRANPRFTPEERTCKASYEALYTNHIYRFMALVVTKVDSDPNFNLDKYIKKREDSEEYRKFISDMGDRAIGVNSIAPTKFERTVIRRYLKDLMCAVLRNTNRNVYTNFMFKFAKDLKKEREREWKRLNGKDAEDIVELMNQAGDTFLEKVLKGVNNIDVDKRMETIKDYLKKREEAIEAVTQEYVNKHNAAQLAQIPDNDYKTMREDVLKALAPEVKACCCKQDDLDRLIRNVINSRLRDLKKIDNKIEEVTKKGVCFPCGSQLTTRTNGKTRIEELNIGDEVLTVNQDGLLEFQPIIFMSHIDEVSYGSVITLQLQSGTTLHLSPCHFLHAGAIGSLLPARSIQKGDVVFVHDENCMKPTTVVGIHREVRRGLFCPHTPGGSIIVNDVLASCYTELVPPRLAHLLLLPARLLYSLLPSSWYAKLASCDKTLGMPSYLYKARSLLMN